MVRTNVAIKSKKTQVGKTKLARVGASKPARSSALKTIKKNKPERAPISAQTKLDPATITRVTSTGRTVTLAEAAAAASAQVAWAKARGREPDPKMVKLASYKRN